MVFFAEAIIVVKLTVNSMPSPSLKMHNLLHIQMHLDERLLSMLV